MFLKKGDGEGFSLPDVFSWKRVWVVVLVFIVGVGVFFTGLIAYANSFSQKVNPNVSIGGVPIGGMEREELETFLETMNNKLLNDGVEVHFETADGPQTLVIHPTIIPGDHVLDFFEMRVDEEVDRLLAHHKHENTLTRAWTVFVDRVFGDQIILETVSLEREEFLSQLDTELEPFLVEPRDASVAINAVNPLDYTVVTSSVGVAFDYTDAAAQVLTSWRRLETPSIKLVSHIKHPEVYAEDIEPLSERLPFVFSENGLEITYTDPHTKQKLFWQISTSDIAAWLNVQHVDDSFGFGLSASPTIQFLEEDIAAKVNVEAQNAKFEIGGNGRVTEFQGSRPGVAVDVQAMYEAINDAILQRSWHDEGIVTSLSLITEQVEPEVKTGEVNELGIQEILGTGYSSFRGSPPNRVKNIRHAVVHKLNGLIIKPDHTFSMLEALRPFTLADGYLPELVIKGDKIEPEIGGGLCQIGSTMFRAAMNSGMPITERRNHSLVVSYYNDPRNGLPGTDATIYDSAPDFKFHNDTGSHILITTSMNESTGDLFFTLWGTSNGRTGYYTEPVVHSWTPAGATQYIETTELAPGVTECQERHDGAVASFDYVTTLADGSTAVETFKSYYRALPEICLVGVDPADLESEEGEEGENSDSEESEEQDGPPPPDEDPEEV